MSIPLVSVGIPTYNRPEGLRRTLEGMSGQTYPNLEIIVSDNCSMTEETTIIGKEFMEKDSRIQYFRQAENKGPIFNFQFVLNKATGDYFMWVADDDWRDPAFISELVALLEGEKDAVLAFCDFHAVDGNSKKITTYPYFLPLLKKFTLNSQRANLRNFIFQKERDGKANLFYSIYRRNILMMIDFTKFMNEYGPWGNDMLFVFQMLCRGKLVIHEKTLSKCTVGNVKHQGEEVDIKEAVNNYFRGYFRIIDSCSTGYNRVFLKLCVWLRIHFYSST